MAMPQFESEARNIGIVGHLLAAGEMLPSQMPSASSWTPEKKLAAAVLAAALVEVRERHGEPHCKRRIAEDLHWIYSDDIAWPYSFVRLCQLFELEPTYVRAMVNKWTSASGPRVPRQCSTHRHAA